ncbi:MAG: hypothetical protein WCJ97_07695 [Phycisphaerae bacterium]
MSKSVVLLLIVFLVALGSGFIAGFTAQRQPMGPGPKPEPRSWLERELKLSDTQKEQMRAIWSEHMRSGSTTQPVDKRRQYARERDDAVVALLTAEQKAEYDRIRQTYDAKVAELNQQREAQFKAAVEKSKAILNPEQQKVYEEILKKGPPGGRGGWGRGNRPGGPESQPASGPGAGPGPGDMEPFRGPHNH